MLGALTAAQVAPAVCNTAIYIQRQELAAAQVAPVVYRIYSMR